MLTEENTPYHQDIAIEVVSTDIADLAMMGFGSIANCRCVCKALQERYRHVTLQVISSRSDLDELVRRQPDLVVAGIKYLIFSDQPITKCDTEKIWLSEYLDDHNIRYTGSSVSAIQLDFDKKTAKDIIQRHGLRTAASFVALPDTIQDEAQLPIAYPLFVKPMYESDSKGVDQDSFVTNISGYSHKVAAIYKEFKQPALVEAYLGGREFTVAVLGERTSDDLRALPVEIVIDDASSANTILDCSIKKSNKEKLIAICEPEVCKAVADLAKKAFIALGARDFGRIDIKMDQQGVAYFLEANLLPGMNPMWSYYPLACQINQNINYSQLVWQMVELALRRL